LNERQLGEYIDAHYQRRGDQLFRMERLPVYEGNAAQTARWVGGATEPDWATKRGWLELLADDKRRGLVSRRVRLFTADMTDDERASCAFGYALNGRYEDIRVLRAGEHPRLDVLDHDYWVIDTRDHVRHVLAMRYDPAGRFLGADVIPPAGHTPYARERKLGWAIAEPFNQWWAKHPDLHRRTAA